MTKISFVFFVLMLFQSLSAFSVGLDSLAKEEERVPGETDRLYCMRLKAFNDCELGSLKSKKVSLSQEEMTKAYHCYIQKQMQIPSQVKSKKLTCDLNEEKRKAQEQRDSSSVGAQK